MKRVFWVSAAVVTIFALSLNAIAQPQGQGSQRQGQGFQQTGPSQMGGQATPQVLLRNAEVVKLLALTEEQTTALNAVIRPQRQAGDTGAAPGTTRPAPGQDGAAPGRAPQAQMTPEQRAEFTAQQRQRTTTMWAEIDKILGAEKATKFKEIYFQANVPVANPNAPADAPVRVMNFDVFLLGAVNLTADQKTKIFAVIDKRDADAAAAPRLTQDATQEERTANRTAATARNTKANDDIKALLTDAQKKKVDELTAGAAKVRTDLNLNAAPGGRGQGTGAAPGGQGRGQGTGGGGFAPGAGTGENFQPGGAGRGTGARGTRGGGGAGGN